MNFRQPEIVIYHVFTFCLLLDAILAQIVRIGDTGLQLEIRGQINCAYSDGVLAGIYWKVSEKGDPTVPVKSIIQYTIKDGITAPDPAYEGRVNMTSDYGLIIDEVTVADINLRYWCQVNIDAIIEDDFADGYEVRPKNAAILEPECGSNCKDGDRVVCEVNGFTPVDEFVITWMVGGVLDPSGIVNISQSEDVFNANSTLEIKGTNLYTCEPSGKAYKYAANDEYGDSIHITSNPITPTAEHRTTSPTTEVNGIPTTVRKTTSLTTKGHDITPSIIIPTKISSTTVDPPTEGPNIGLIVGLTFVGMVVAILLFIIFCPNAFEACYNACFQ